MESLLPWLADRILLLIPIILSLSVHEWAHAASACVLGDDTAKHMGRLTLNPIPHIDPLGALLPLLGVPFGWAKPVPINPVRFRERVSMRTGVLLTAAAGPFSNLCVAFLCLAALVGLEALSPGFGMRNESAAYLLELMIPLNIALALFNLIPIPPLDGSLIVDSLISRKLRPFWDTISSMGPIVLFVLFVVFMRMNAGLINTLFNVMP